MLVHELTPSIFPCKPIALLSIVAGDLVLSINCLIAGLFMKALTILDGNAKAKRKMLKTATIPIGTTIQMIEFFEKIGGVSCFIFSYLRGSDL